MALSKTMKRQKPARTSMGISLDLDIAIKGRQAAKRERRTFSRYIETLIEKAIQETKSA